MASSAPTPEHLISPAHFLLNPRIGRAPNATSRPRPASNSQSTHFITHPEAHASEDIDTLGTGSLIEKIHGLRDREERPQKRRKHEHVNEDGTELHKASGFTGGGKGGVITEYMQQKKEEGKKEAASAGSVVDLTTG